MPLSLSDREDRWRCHSKGCNQQFQLKSGTWLGGSHLDYKTAVLFIYCWSYGLTKISFCSRELGISKETCVDWNNYMREVCVLRPMAETQKLAVLGCMSRSMKACL